MKKIIISSIAIFIFAAADAQKKSDSTKPAAPPPIMYHDKALTDSTEIFSLKDLNTFTSVLKKGLSYEEYIALTPEKTIAALWNWKLQTVTGAQSADKPKPKP